MSDVAPVLEARGLTVSWEGMGVLDDVSLSVGTGQLVCLVGRSGSGKSTLFHALAGLSRPDSGVVLLEGEDVTGRPGRIAYMLQKDLLLPERTVLDNTALPLLLKGVPKAEARARASERFARFGLEGSQGLYPDQLSGGMRQRAALIRTLAVKPEIFLLDEAFSALDYQTRLEVTDDIYSILRREGKTMVMVTHDIPESISMSDRVVVLSGRPAHVRSVHPIEFEKDHLTPLARRDDPHFNQYFSEIWKELRGNEA